MGNKIKLGLAIVNNKTIKIFNKKYLASDTATDVIAFDVKQDLLDGYYFLGDVVISVDQVKRNAQKFQVPEAEELARVITHGVLHLMGYDDKDKKQKAKMQIAENQVLEKVFPLKK